MRKTPGVSGGWPPTGVARGLAANGRHPVECRDEKAQLSHRLPAEFIRRTLSDFNARALDATTASAHLEVSRARLYPKSGSWRFGIGVEVACGMVDGIR